MPSERTSRRSGASFSSPVGACSSARRCGQSVGLQREGMIDYALAGEPWSLPPLVFFACRLHAAILESGGATEGLFANFIEQRRCKKICGATTEGEAEC